MSLPSTVSEEEFVRVVERTAKILYKQLGTLIGTKDDFIQQVALWALEAMPKYDPQRSLEGYIFSHTRNRALNWVRDHYHRADPPCKKCDSGTPCGEDGNCCRKYEEWARRNQAKANLARPIGIDRIEERTHASTAEDDAVGRELRQLVDEQLPVELRAFYLRMLAGDKTVATAHRRKVQQAVSEILGYPLHAEGQSSRGAKVEESFGECSEQNIEQERTDHLISAASNPLDAPTNLTPQEGNNSHAQPE